MKRMMHVNLAEGEVAPFVIIVGSPERAEKIASFFDSYSEMAYHREYRTFTGQLKGMPISVCSTGIGGPSMAIAIEELSLVGAESFLRAGTCISVSEDVKRKDLALIQAAVRLEGVTCQYAPPEFPAVVDVGLLMDAEKAIGCDFHIGTCISRSSYYAPFDGLARPNGKSFSDVWNACIATGAIVSDMDTSTFYLVAETLKKRAIALLVCTNDVNTPVYNLEDDPEDCEDILIKSALRIAEKVLKKVN